jgi:hypothetical protein
MAIEQNQDYVHNGDIEFNAGVKVTTGATNGYVLTSDASGNASWAASGSGVVQSATVTITSAELLNIHTTPIELVAAQGAGTVIVPIQITLWIDYNTTAYATDVALRLYFDDNVTSWLNLGAVLDKTADYFLMRSIQVTAAATGANFFDNTNLAISTALSNPTAGDSDVKITVLYSVINL